MQMFRSNKKVTLIFLISLKLFYDEVLLYFSRKIVETFNNLNAILFSLHAFLSNAFFTTQFYCYLPFLMNWASTIA